MMPPIKTIVVMLICSALPLVGVAQTTKIDPAMQRAAEEAAALIRVTPEMQQRVNDLQREMQSQAWQEKILQMQKQAAETIGVGKEYQEATQDAPEKPATGGDRLYVFGSHSMPLDTLRRYAASLEKVPGGVLLLRGFVGGGRETVPTVRFIADILKVDPDCEGPECKMRNVEVLIDPILFSRHQITRVPAVVYVENVENIGHCEEGKTPLPPATPAIYGDAALGYAVARLNKQTPRPGLARLQKLLGG